jgi:hypothetical protein
VALAEGGGDRAEAEAEVAAAREELGRPQPDAEAAVTQAAQTDHVQADVAHPAPPATDPTPDPASPPASEVEAEGQGTTADAEAQTEPAPESTENAETATQEQNA